MVIKKLIVVPVEVKVAFGIVLRRLRKSADLSQEKLALNADIDRTYIGTMERGEKQPTITTLFHLSKALGVLPDEIIKCVRLEVENT